jgi:hypothetical protein
MMSPMATRTRSLVAAVDGSASLWKCHLDLSLAGPAGLQVLRRRQLCETKRANRPEAAEP